MKLLTIDDGPEILSKYLSVLDDEVERILSLDPKKRELKDIKIAIAAATFLTTMNKADIVMQKSIKNEFIGDYKPLNPIALAKYRS